MRGGKEMSYTIGLFELTIMLAISLIINFCLIILVWQMLEKPKEVEHGKDGKD